MCKKKLLVLDSNTWNHFTEMSSGLFKNTTEKVFAYK